MNNEIPISRPTLVPLEDLRAKLEEIWEGGQVTQGHYTQQLESAACMLTGTAHAVALNSCTSGLMLVLAALGIEGEVVMPSFTWASTAHSAIWNGLKPVFADVKFDTLTLDPDDVKRAITERTGAVMATNTFGLPPDIDALEEICSERGIPLILDAAQGIGAGYKGRSEGCFGTAEVFSMSPTKVVTALEGGLVTTNDGALADKVRSMRDYGKGSGPNGPDILRVGLSARMSEVHAVVGLSQMDLIGRLVTARRVLDGRYRELLGRLAGVRFQEQPAGYLSAHTYSVILVDKRNRAGRDGLRDGLAELGIHSKPYFWPPVHMQSATSHLAGRDLRVTDVVSRQALALPLWSDMPLQVQDRVIEGIHKIVAG